MKEFIENLMGRLEEEILTCQNAYTESIIGMCGKSAENYMIEMHAYKKTKKIVNQLAEEHNNGWIPVEERLPDTNDYILLSFSNFTIPAVGRYEVEEDGSGAFYIGDELETCVSQELFVNAWQPLPEPYKECE